MAATQLSPGVQIVEKDASLIVPGASSTVGATVGVFKWGPTLQPILVSNENDIVSVFGKPSRATAKYFFTSANFLRYASAAYVVRADNDSVNAVGTYETTLENYAQRPAFVAVEIGNGDVYDSNFSVSVYDPEAAPAENPAIVAARYPGDLGNGLIVSFADASTFDSWSYKDEFVTAPGTSDFVYQRAIAAGLSAVNAAAINDEMHIIVIDGAGKFTGTSGAVLEKYAFVSKASDALTFEGKRNYYVDVISTNSNYIYVLAHPHFALDWGNLSEGKTAPFEDIFSGLGEALTTSLVKGVAQDTVTDGQLQAGYDLFADDQSFDVSLIPVGEVSVDVIKYVVENIAERRKDCVVFASVKGVADGATDDSEAFMITNTTVGAEQKARNYANLLNPSSYLVVDSGFMYQYDRYNDQRIWVALNGSIAGLCARVDQTDDSWFSPGGFTRGQIKSVIKLAWNPTRAQRDVIYQRGINPVVAMPGQGTVLFGDKTFQAKPSAFDRINVRRLFIALEKSIAMSARFNLFDLNNELTRSLFVGRVEPFLRDVQARQGIEDFRVVCDETNNPPAVRARNEFRGTILVKPVYSINFITLTFTAVGPNVSFDTAAGV
ncbi:tail sheath [Synechococcus phage BUCT-ZZ01]|nr:tail sheath [Synechococcus phage BUCT-ZZ01]